MHLWTKSDIIATIARSWKSRFVYRDLYGCLQWRDMNPSQQEIYDQLLALPSNASEEQAISIIGSNVWTANQCDECEQDTDVLVVLGGAEEESDEVRICLTCLRAGLALMESEDVHG